MRLRQIEQEYFAVKFKFQEAVYQQVKTQKQAGMSHAAIISGMATEIPHSQMSQIVGSAFNDIPFHGCNGKIIR